MNIDKSSFVARPWDAVPDPKRAGRWSNQEPSFPSMSIRNALADQSVDRLISDLKERIELWREQPK
jgi:hypothetical protein